MRYSTFLLRPNKPIGHVSINEIKEVVARTKR